MKKGFLGSPYRIFRALFALAFAGLSVFLIVESATPGAASAAQSNAVAGGIGSIINVIGQDQASEVKPSSLSLGDHPSSMVVGSEYDLTYSILPADASDQSVVFSSSDQRVASISPTGLIKALKPGQTTISVTSSILPDISQSFSLEVVHSYATSMSTLILEAAEIDGVYELHKGTSYSLSTSFEPEGATYTELTYLVDKTSFIQVSNGAITTKKHSFGEITEITVSQGGLSNVLRVIVKDLNLIDLESIGASDMQMTVTESAKVKDLSFYPNATTFKEYSLTSSDPTVVSVNGDTLTAKKAGEASVTVQSTVYPAIDKTISVTVSPQPQATSFALSKSFSTIYVGETKPISVKSILPKYATVEGLVLSSSDNTVLTVDSSKLKVTAASVGTAQVIGTLGAFQTSVTVEVSQVPTVVEDPVDSFTMEVDSPFIAIGTPTNLKNVAHVSSWSPSAPNDKTLSYSLLKGNGTIDEGTITAASGEPLTILATHVPSGRSASFQLTPYSPFKVMQAGVEVGAKSFSKAIGSSLVLTIDQQCEVEGQGYSASSSDESIMKVYAIGKSVVLSFVGDGHASLTIGTLIGGTRIPGADWSIACQSGEVYATSLDITLIGDEGPITLTDEPASISVGQSMTLRCSTNDEATYEQLSFASDKEDIVSVDDSGVLTALKAGNAKITVLEVGSGLHKTVSFKSSNVIKLKAEGHTVKGSDLKVEDGIFKIQTKTSATIDIAFSEDTTYRDIVFASSNTSVLTVGQDGTVTAKKAGKATVTATIDDGVIETPIVLSFQFEAHKKSLITSFSEFAYFIRKFLGHFSAFLVVGVFGSLTFFMFLRKKKLLIAVPASVTSGFALAALTEFIQHFTPGRYGAWADVFLDFEGFLVGVGFVLMLFGLIYLIRKIKSNKEKKA